MHLFNNSISLHAKRMHIEAKYLLLDHFQLANVTVASHDLRAIIG